MKNVMNFLRTGQYVVAYPKKVTSNQPASSCCDHHGPTKDPKKDAQKQDVESLFSRIEKEMGVNTSSPLSKDELNLALTNTVIKSASSVHNEDDFRGRSTQPRDSGHGHDHQHGHDHGHNRPMREVDDDDDYDLEFADSQYNSYYERYHAQEEEDGDADGVNNNAFYDQQDDEESLLRSRKY
jgi:hypothetical protein